MPEGRNRYRPRIYDELLKLKLSAMGAVLVEGAKWCGKTTTCEQQAKSVLYMANPVKRKEYLQLAEINIEQLLAGEKPRLIDEWQDAPQFWDAIRFKVDREGAEGQFILTGSAVPPDAERISHSGTGRFARIKMRPMSLWESGESSGEVSLKSLFSGISFDSAASQELTLDEMAFIVCRGGWPQTVGRTGDRALVTAQEYLEGVVESDISRVDNVSRNPERVHRILRSCARLLGTQANISAIQKDLSANDIGGIDEETIYSYVNALKKIFVIEDLAAWCPSLRAKGAIRTTDTRYFVDPSIAAAAMGVGPGNLLNDLRSFGYFFESLAVRDLRVYMDSMRGHVEKYHDKTGLECDAVLHTPDGRYALVEIKLGGETLIGEGVRSLDKLYALIRGKGIPEPVFRMVLTATGGYAYRSGDVIICPISCLKQ
ncbi:MAG: ATP-binding protein [Victivallales bacterium]|nr:ATP-binding protein [Victivallales bacterium]